MYIGEVITALRKIKVETGSLACLGCEHEAGCSTHGCAVMREAADMLERSAAAIGQYAAERNMYRGAYLEIADMLAGLRGVKLPELPEDVLPDYDGAAPGDAGVRTEG